MADPTPINASTPIVESVQTPIVAPVVTSTPAVETPSVTSVEAPIAVVAPVTPVVKPAETVIGAELDKKPVETPKETPVVTPEGQVPEVKQTEGGQSDEPAPPPKYEAFKLPEGITLEPERVNKFTEILSKLETKAKVDHNFAQEFGQEAVDFHISEMKNQAEFIQKSQIEAWETQKVNWKNEIINDPELGGNRLQTTVDSALNFIRTHGGSPEEQVEFRNLMETSGLGNNRIMIRLLAKAGRAMSEGTPLAAPKPVADAKSKTETLYGRRK